MLAAAGWRVSVVSIVQVEAEWLLSETADHSNCMTCARPSPDGDKECADCFDARIEADPDSVMAEERDWSIRRGIAVELVAHAALHGLRTLKHMKALWAALEIHEEAVMAHRAITAEGSWLACTSREANDAARACGATEQSVFDVMRDIRAQLVAGSPPATESSATATHGDDCRWCHGSGTVSSSIDIRQGPCPCKEEHGAESATREV